MTTAAQTIPVSNTGTASLVINSVTLGGTHGNRFGMTNGCGTVVVPTFTVAPSSVPLGTRAIRTASPPQAVVATNTGTLPVPITGVTVAGTSATQFSQTNNCGTSLAVGVSCTINVRFSPTTTGAKSATLNVNVSAPATSQTAALSGTGQ